MRLRGTDDGNDSCSRGGVSRGRHGETKPSFWCIAVCGSSKTGASISVPLKAADRQLRSNALYSQEKTACPLPPETI
ncbi:hypothetical protein MRX96_055715 [Rhipicephalus microplus]